MLIWRIIFKIGPCRNFTIWWVVTIDDKMFWWICNCRACSHWDVSCLCCWLPSSLQLSCCSATSCVLVIVDLYIYYCKPTFKLYILYIHDFYTVNRKIAPIYCCDTFVYRQPIFTSFGRHYDTLPKISKPDIQLDVRIGWQKVIAIIKKVHNI